MAIAKMMISYSWVVSSATEMGRGLEKRVASAKWVEGRVQATHQTRITRLKLGNRENASK